MPDRNDVTLRHERLGHPLAVDERAVGRPQVDDLDGNTGGAVPARTVTVPSDDAAIGPAAISTATAHAAAADPTLRADSELGVVSRGQ